MFWRAYRSINPPRHFADFFSCIVHGSFNMGQISIFKVVIHGVQYVTFPFPDFIRLDVPEFFRQQTA
jgi:hypothetical protein